MDREALDKNKRAAAVRPMCWFCKLGSRLPGLCVGIDQGWEAAGEIDKSRCLVVSCSA
jgi:hypothetical protein